MTRTRATRPAHERRCGQRCCTSLLYAACERPVPRSEPAADLGALGGTRTPNLLIRSQMLYPLSYERKYQQYTAFWWSPCAVVSGLRASTAVIELLIF